MEEPEELLKNAEIFAYEIIQDLISAGAELLYQNYVSEKSIPFSAKSTLEVVFSTIELYYLRHDMREVPDWSEDPEPLASSIDTWARNAIPVKKKIKMPQTEQSSVILPPDAKSSMSYSSRRSGLGRIVKQSRSLRNQKDNIPIEEGVIPMPIPEDKNDVSEEEEMLRSRKERELKRKKEEVERLKKIKEEEAEKEKRMQKEADEMKKKSFTYDHKGKIIFVNPVKHDNIPNTFTAIRYVAEEPLKEEPKPQVKRNPPRDFAAVKRLKSAPMQEKEWVKNITSIQLPMFEAIKLSANVTFIDGSRTKYPTENREEFKTMSRKQYNAIYQTKQEAEINISAGLPDKKSPSVSSGESLKKSPDSKKDLLDIIPDYESLAERSEQSNIISTSLSPLRVSQHGKIIQYGTSFQLDESAGPNQKFNAEIIKSKNWGLNPPMKEPKVIERYPKRPDSKEMRELYGDILKKPKDNPFITPQELWQVKGPKIKKPRDRPNIERVEKKTRMPPPPYGFTMINALPEIAGLVGSNGSGNSMNRSELIK